MIGLAVAILNTLLQAPIPKPSVVARFNRPMVAGVAVSKSGRVFLTFPRWGDPVEATLMEWNGGALTPYPNPNYNRMSKKAAATRLVNAQSAVVDDQDRLWVLDTGSINFGMTIYKGPKLIAIDLATNKVIRTYGIPPEAALATSYLNDVRLDTVHGKAGYAVITDSSSMGPNGLIVIDLDSGDAWRRLNNHPSTAPDPSVTPMVEGAGLRVRPQVGADSALRVGADGLALDPKAGLAYYCPMISRKLYSVNLALLEDRSKSDAEVEASVQDLGEKGVSDGLVTDADGVLYLTDVENNLVKRRQADGTFQTIMRFSKYFWVDSLAIQNGELYATGNELQRLPTFNKGVDRREKRNVVAKIKLGP